MTASLGLNFFFSLLFFYILLFFLYGCLFMQLSMLICYYIQNTKLYYKFLYLTIDQLIHFAQDYKQYKRKKSSMIENLYQNIPETEYKSQIQNPLSDIKIKNKLIQSIYGLQGFAKQHIDSYDEFLNFRAQQIVTSRHNRRVICDSVPDFWMQYQTIRIGKPTHQRNYDKFSKESKLFPHQARTSNLSYSADIYVDIKYFLNGVIEQRKNVKIGRMPIMLGCSKCHLVAKTQKQLSYLKQCPYDPRGYFIVNGTQKVILIQEQMIQNRILVQKNPKMDTIVAGVISYTIDTKTMCEMLLKNDKIYVRTGSFSQLIPVFVLFKAFGMESDQQVFQSAHCTSKMEEFLVSSLEDCHKRNIFTCQDAIQYLGTKLWTKKFESRKQKNPITEVKDKLCNILLAHIKVSMDNMLPKAHYLALMMKKLIDGINDNTKLDNRDYYGNKRMKCAGTLMQLLFQDKFKMFNSDLRIQFNKFLIKHRNSRNIEIAHLLQSRSNLITNGLHIPIATGDWIIKRFHIERKGVSQQLSRISYISAIGMITRLNSQFEKTRKIAGPRALLGSHWGMICPCDTPDGQGCGLVKNLALTTCITTSARNFKWSNLGIVEGNISQGRGHRVTLDGTVLGYVFNQNIVKRIRLMRRKGLIEKFVNVSIIRRKDQEFGQIMINTDSGRLVRPLLILEQGKLLLTNEMVRQLDDGRITFEDLLKKGVIQFLDVNQQDNALIALKVQQLTPSHTHMEIDPFTIIGVVAGIIPYPHHNQSPRNLFQCSMGKQAQGITGLNQMIRPDTVNYMLVYPQQPLVKTAHIELINYDKLPAGQNASVAVMSYSGYDIQDAVVINRASMDRGFGRTFYYRRYETQLKKYNDIGIKDYLMGKSQQIKAINESGRKIFNNDYIFKKYKCLDEDGLPKVAHSIQSGDIFVNKKVPVVSPQIKDKFKLIGLSQNQLSWHDQPSVFKSNSTNYHIDRVILTSNQQSAAIVKTMVRQMRRPQLGDKFSSRHGQKGVCGLIVNQEDMPFSQNGWRPDLIMNPHGYPSRMTVGKLLELVSAKAGSLHGSLKYGTSFGGQKLQQMSKVLIKHGFSYDGKDALISGTSGQYITCYVFSGPIFYQRLKHMVADKIHARSTGKVTVLTRQPTQGRSKEGGLRLGQMQRDCLLGFGASDLLLERLLYSSDDYMVMVCQGCGFFKHTKTCKSCRKKNVHKIRIPYACKLLFQQLISMGIRPKLNLGKAAQNPFKQ